jgi:O-antigen/teichoic acid export membrane protein
MALDPETRSGAAGHWRDAWNKAAHSVALLASGEVAARAIAFFATAYLARQLAPEGFGILGLAAAYAGYFAVAVTGGTNDTGAREVARRPADARSLAASVMAARLAVAVAAMVVLGAITLLIDKPSMVKVVILLTSLSFLTQALNTSWVYNGLQRSRRVSGALILSQVVYLGLVLWFVNGPEDVLFVPILQVAGELAAVVSLGVPLLTRGTRIRLREGFRLVWDSRYLTGSKLLRVLILTLDVILISFMIGEVEVGVYTAAYRLCYLVLAIATAVQVAHLPSFSRASAAGPGAVREVSRTAFQVSGIVGAPLVFGGIVLAHPLLRTLFGVDYAPGAPALRWLLLSMGFIFLRGNIHSLFVVFDRTRQEMRILGFAVVVNLTLNLLLIPRYGITGAAVATAAAEGSVIIAGLYALASSGIRLDLRPVGRPMLAAGLMGAVLLSLGMEWMLPVQLFTGALLYAVALVAVGGIPARAVAQARGKPARRL